MFTIRLSVVAFAAFLAAWMQVPAPDALQFVATDRVAVRVMSQIPAIDLAPGVRVRTVVGTVASFSVAEFEPGSAAVLHHHTREQADISLAGSFDMTIGERVEKLAPGYGVVVPPNVAHSIANKGSERMSVIEFHTVRRPDLVPPRPPITFPASEKPVSLADGRQLIYPLDRPIRESPFSAYWLRGETCMLAWRRLSSGTGAVEIRARDVEYFVYVVRGELNLKNGDSQERIREGTLVVIPAQGIVTIQAAGPAGAAVAEFTPERR
jgi:mannose-6-phosphate isomerase-like protein (cupin superfamily)